MSHIGIIALTKILARNTLQDSREDILINAVSDLKCNHHNIICNWQLIYRHLNLQCLFPLSIPVSFSQLTWCDLPLPPSWQWQPHSFTLYKLSIFSILFSIHSLWWWQVEFCKQSKPLRFAIIPFILMILMKIQQYCCKAKSDAGYLEVLKG